MRGTKQRLLSLLLVLVMVLGILPVAAADEGVTLNVSISNCTQIGTFGGEYPLYLYDSAVPAEANTVTFTDFADKMSEGMIASLQYAFVEGTNVVPLTAPYALDPAELEDTDSWTIHADYASYDFSDCYAYWIMDDDYDMYYFVIKAPTEEVNPFGQYPFYPSVGNIQSCTEDGYSYTDWNGEAARVDLYTVEVPFGTQEVTLNFQEDRIAYGYDRTGEWLGSCGEYENNGQQGKKTAVIAADERGVLPDFIRVQTPYTEQWSSDTLYAVQFVYNYTFTASVDGSVLTEMTYAPNAYRYYDYMTQETVVVAVYTLTVPNDTETVEFQFSDHCLAYSYTKNGDYLNGWYSGDSYMTGSKTASVSVDYGTQSAPADGEPDYIQIQTPYDSDWYSRLLYAVTFQKEGGSPEIPDVPDSGKADMNGLLEGIASGYQNTYSNSKVIIDMAAYEDLNPSTSYKTTSEAKQNYINFALSALTENNVAETTYSLAILGLQGIGVDPRALYPVNSNTAIDAVAGLNSVSHSASAWTAPYTLAAYNQGNYGTDAYEQALIADVLGAQRSDGSWTEYDDSIQTTANMITGLSFYYKTSDDVKTAVDKGISYLSTQQKADGTFDAYGYGSDADSCANVVTALASVGIRPDTDTRFVKEGNSALDGLMTFALADNSGFGYRDNTTKNDYATEEGFRALIAAAQVMSTGTAYNIYDFSGNVVAPGRATGEGAVEKPSTPNTDHTISVYFTLKSDVDYWIPRTTVIVKEGSTVYHVFTQALDDAGITYTGAENGYVTSITKGSKTLAEFSKGENSGWLYKVNGDLPDVGLTSYVLEDGDNVLWYYTEDWTKDSAAGLKQPAISSDAKVTENTDGTYTVTLPEDSDGPVRVVIPNVKDGQIVVIVGKDGSEKVVKKSVVRNGSAYLLLEADATVRVVDRANAFGDVTANDWYAAAVDFVTGRGLFSGVTEDEFAPNMTLNRGMLVTVLYALEEPGKLTGKGNFYDVSPDVWYAQGVAWATQAGIVSGFGDGLFGPEEPITREQLALMLYQYAKIQGLSTGANTSLIGFRDQGDVSSWAREAVTWAVEAGIISGRPDGTLDPAGTATRAEAAVMLRQLVTLMTQA